MFRFNNPDALLVLVMTLAAYAITRALESGRTRWLALTGALLGLGFLTKMLQAFLVLPVFALVYLVAGPPRSASGSGSCWPGGAALLAAAGWWVAIVLLTPAADRPYVGGSTDNNILQLTFGYNGLGRLTGNGVVGRGRPGGGAGSARALRRRSRRGGRCGAGAGRGRGRPRVRRRGGGPFGGGTGITRLFTAEMGGQIGWLIPAALIALAAHAVAVPARRPDRPDPRRRDPVGRLAGGDGPGVQLHVRHHPPVLRGRAGSRDRRAHRHRRGHALWRARRTWFARAAMAAALAGHRGLGLGAARPQPRAGTRGCGWSSWSPPSVRPAVILAGPRGAGRHRPAEPWRWPRSRCRWP